MSSRQALIDATLELLGQHGFRGMTTKAIAERAGLSEVTLFRQFGSKVDLTAAALEQASQPFRDAIRSPTDDLEADLIGVAAGYVQFVDAWPALIDRVLPELAAQAEIGEAVRSIVAGNVAATVALVEHHQVAGRLGSDAPAADLVRAFIGPLMARASLRHLLPVGPFDATSYATSFVEGYAGRAGPTAEL